MLLYHLQQVLLLFLVGDDTVERPYQCHTTLRCTVHHLLRLRHQRLRSSVAIDKDHSVTRRSATAFAFTVFRRPSRLSAHVAETVERSINPVLEPVLFTPLSRANYAVAEIRFELTDVSDVLDAIF